jgi:orotate phosphoribosyltransferase-like protein
MSRWAQDAKGSVLNMFVRKRSYKPRKIDVDESGGMRTWEIAKELGISRQGVEWILDSAFKKLRNNEKLRKIWEDI